MSGGIYLIQDSGELVEMTEQPYGSEALLQALLAQHPAILAGDQMDSSSPRKWLLIAREVPIPGEQAGGARWALDHLFLDQDAIPTLVEVKRSSDTRIRREVVGQMLDYAANGVVYWPLEMIRGRFQARCETEGRSPDEVLRMVFGADVEAEEFWQKAKTNLQAGRVRLVFVADEIPDELKRIVEFLNEQMDPAEVLAVEIRQYVGDRVKTLVPRVMGQTAAAQTRKGAGAGGRLWDRATFLNELRNSLSHEQVVAVERVMQTAEKNTQDLGFGRGKTGSISPKFSGASSKSFFTVRTDGTLQINRKWHEQADAGERAAHYRDEFVKRLVASSFDIGDNPYPTLAPEEWTGKVDALVHVITEVFGGTKEK
jgi:hypothetical protein